MKTITIMISIGFVLTIQDVSAQDSGFLLIGPDFGINRSWRSYEHPVSEFKTNSSNGFEGGLNVFHKSKRSFGFLARLGYLEARSAITAYDYSSASTIDISEASKWLTAGAAALFFPLPENRTLVFLGAGLDVAYLDRADVSLRITRKNPDEESEITRNLEDSRTKSNCFLKVVSGITIHQFDKHRIVLTTSYSRMLKKYTKNSTGELIGVNPLAQYITPNAVKNDYSINTFTIKLMVAL